MAPFTDPERPDFREIWEDGYQVRFDDFGLAVAGIAWHATSNLKLVDGILNRRSKPHR